MFSCKIIIQLILIIQFISLIFLQSLDIQDYKYLGFNRNSRNIESNLADNYIVDIKGGNNAIIFIGTGEGLSKADLNYNPTQYEHFNSSNMPSGGNPSLYTGILSSNYIGYQNNTLVIVSGSEASTYDSSISAGTGLAWSLDNGLTWNYIHQPLDLDCGDFLYDECIDQSECTWDSNLNRCIYNNYYFEDIPITNNIPMIPIISEGYLEELYSYPIVVPEYNVIYDISVDLKNGYIYTANYYGMLRRFKFYDFINEALITEPVWELVPLLLDDQPAADCGNYINDINSPFLNLPVSFYGNWNHQVFSVHIEEYDGNNYIWVGTAFGLNKGIIINDGENSGCIDWLDIYSCDDCNEINDNLDSDELGGNWIIDIATQDIGTNYPRIWLISWTRPQANPHRLTFSDDNGLTWNKIDFFIEDEIRAISKNLSFHNNFLYVSTDKGLYYVNHNLDYYDMNDPSNWSKIIFNDDIYDIIQTEEVKASLNFNDKFFIGTSSGLLEFNCSDPNLLNQNDCMPEIEFEWYTEENKLSIFPNPFDIQNINSVRFLFETNINNIINGVISIYDFNMDKVFEFNCTQNNPHLDDDYLCIWNGRNFNNEKVANGVYFCKINIDNKELWEKLIVINNK